MTTSFGLAKMFKSKRGQVENYFAVVASLFAFALSFITAMVILTAFINGFNGSGFCGTVCQSTAEKFSWALQLFDSIMILVVVVLIIAVALTSYKLPASAAFFIISIVMAPILGYVSYFFNYVFSQIVSQAAFDAVRVYFPKTIIICTNFHWIALILFVVGSITLYAKREQGQFVEG